MSMKLRKNLGRLATAFVATAMLASVAAVPASANGEEPETGSEGETSTSVAQEVKDGKIVITKTLAKDIGVYTPNVEFEFTVTPADPDTNEVDDNKIKVEKGPKDGVKPDDTENGDKLFTFTPDDATLNLDSDEDDAYIVVDISKFTGDYGHAGVYKYTVEEKVPENKYEGIEYDLTDYTMYVYIENDGKGGLKFANATLFTEVTDSETQTTKKVKQEQIENAYGQGTTPDTDVVSLVLAKDLDGNSAEMNRKFNFDVTIKGADGEQYNIIYGVIDPETNEFTPYTKGKAKNEPATSGTPVTITLGELEAVQITGLSKTDFYTITEKEGGTEGYTTTVTGDTFDEDDDGNTTYTVTGSLLTGTGENQKLEDGTIIYKNFRDSVTPTGIVMNVAPYALLVVVAAGACFVFLRKRRED